LDILQLLVLAVVQGVTEFLPISSSGHLILAPRLFGFSDQGLSLDVAVHLGSLIAVISYFRQDIARILIGWTRSLSPGSPQTDESRLGWAVIVGVIPIVVIGVLVKQIVENELRSAAIIAVTTIVFGLLLAWADSRARRDRELSDITLRDAFLIGLAQILALIPGTSRSGITMTAGLMLGLTREAASRFSFLLAIPTILGSSLLITLDLINDEHPADWASLGLGVALSAIAAYICIHLFLRYIEKTGMWPFVVYRLMLGALIIALIV